MKQERAFITVAVSLGIGVGFAVAVPCCRQHQEKQVASATPLQNDMAAAARPL